MGDEISTVFWPGTTVALYRPSVMTAPAVGVWPSTGTKRICPVLSTSAVERHRSGDDAGGRLRRASVRQCDEGRAAANIRANRHPIRYSSLIVSSPLMVPIARHTARAMPSCTGRTEPSPKATLTPPTCRLRAAFWP